MRVSPERKSLDIEAREVNYIMGALIQNYLFASKNEDPVEIIFPMFPAVPHPRKPGVMIPIRWISPTDPIAIEIAKDGSNIPEVTSEEEAVLDAKDEAVAKQSGGVEAGLGEQQLDTSKDAIDSGPEAPQEVKVEEPPTKEPDKQPDRLPKMPPGGDIGPGSHPDTMGSRDAKMDRRIAKDINEEPDVEEDKEIPTDIDKPKE